MPPLVQPQLFKSRTCAALLLAGVTLLASQNGSDGAVANINSITRKDPSPSNADQVRWDIEFSRRVTALAISNFELVEGGDLSGASIVELSGSNRRYVITAKTGSNSGPLGLDLANDTGVSPSISNEPFTGEIYTIDRTPPEITAPANITVECTSPAGESVDLGSPTVSDAIDPSPTVTNDAPGTFALGTTTVTWTATDASGNSSTATQSVTVEDTTAPSIVAPGNVTLECSGPAGETIELGAPTVGDACDPSPSVAHDAPDTFVLGSTTVTWTATDASGNSATATQTVTVEDTTAPSIVAPGNITLECSGPAGETIELGSPSVGDTCDSPPSVAHDAPNTFVLGTTTVTWTATDASGNSATATQAVTVADTTAPSIVAPGDITLECSEPAGGSIDLGLPFTSDGCDTAPSVGSDAPDLFPFGETTVTWTVVDASGNSATATQTVTVEDTTPPSITAPPDLTVECTSPAGVIVDLGSPDVTDACDESPVVGRDAPTLFQLGTTTVTWIAADANGNAATAMQTVTVADTVAPSITAPADITLECGSNETIDLGSPEVSDACDASPTVVRDEQATCPLGDSTVIWTATDASGNSASTTQTVTVQDTTPPAIAALADITVECSDPAGETVELGTPTVSDACGAAATITHDGPSSFLLGATIVTWTATDALGNSATTTQSVTIEDTTPPMTPILADVTGAGSVTVTPPATPDICSGMVLGTTTDPLIYTVPGTFTVRWTFDDSHGNSIAADQTVIVEPLPVLNIVPAEPGWVTISWTQEDQGWVLQETVSHSPVNWIFSPSGSATRVTVPAPAPTKWFRLVRPR